MIAFVVINFFLSFSVIFEHTNEVKQIKQSKIRMKEKITYPINYGLSKTGLPLIAVEMEGNNICFLVDTGATLNLLDKRVYEHINKNKGQESKSVDTVANFGIEGVETKAPRAELNFEFENGLFKTKFTIFDTSTAFNKVEEESGIQIHGILGNEFLLENEWIINYETLKIQYCTSLT